MKHKIKSYSTLLLGIIIGVALLPFLIAMRVVFSLWQVAYYTSIDIYKYAKDLKGYSNKKENK